MPRGKPRIIPLSFEGELVILSSPLLVEDGIFRRQTISLEKAKRLVRQAWTIKNFCGHQTVKILGLEPAQERGACQTFNRALVLQPKQRLEFGRDYSVQEILDIGIIPVLIEKIN